MRNLYRTESRKAAALSALQASNLRGRRRTAVITVLVAVIVAGGIALVGFTVPLPHSWSFTNSKTNGAFESFPSGSQVDGQWSSPEPAYIQIVMVSTGDFVCTSNAVSCGPTTLSELWAASGTFDFTSDGGQVQFIAMTHDNVTISLGGTWSAVMW